MREARHEWSHITPPIRNVQNGGTYRRSRKWISGHQGPEDVKWRVTAKGCEISFWGDKNVLKSARYGGSHQYSQDFGRVDHEVRPA